MTLSEEIRQIRELVASLQFGLLRTLNHLEALGQHVGAGQEFAEDIQVTKQIVMNLRQSPAASSGQEPSEISSTPTEQ